MPGEEEARAIGNILERWRFANQWEPFPDDDHNLTIAAWYEVLQAGGVPYEAYGRCYEAALSSRMKRKARGEKVLNLSAEDLAVEWPAVRDEFMRRNAKGQKLLAANSKAGCPRCFGTGSEVMPDGSVRSDCAHEPLTKAEMAERAKLKADLIAGVRADASRRAMPQPGLRVAKDPGVVMECGTCAREVDSREGWQVGEQCKALRDGKKCDGRMRVKAMREVG